MKLRHTVHTLIAKISSDIRLALSQADVSMSRNSEYVDKETVTRNAVYALSLKAVSKINNPIDFNIRKVKTIRENCIICMSMVNFMPREIKNASSSISLRLQIFLDKRSDASWLERRMPIVRAPISPVKPAVLKRKAPTKSAITIEPISSNSSLFLKLDNIRLIMGNESGRISR